jgi:PAS domain S-box-containing protein
MTANQGNHDNEIELLRKRVAELELENKHVRALVEVANQSIADKQVLFTQLLDAMEDMILVKDQNSHIVYANRAFRDFYAMTMEELQGIIDAPINPEEWTNQYLIDDAYVINTGNNLTIEEEPVTRHDGQIRYFNTIKSAVFSVAAQANLMVAVCRDITERKEVERRVNEFNSMVSHELRTPLTAIRAALGLIEGGQTEPISQTNMELVHIANTECDRMIRLINDLLDIKKIAANKLDLKLEPLNATDIIAPVVASMSGLARECQISLAFEIEDARTFIGDRDRIIQVVANLVSNAIKFSPAGNDVQIKSQTAGENTIRFSCRDHGPGIQERDFDKLFLAFHQIDSSDTRAKGGTGLGLAISKAIIERHGGEIGFETALGGGTTFWFELPVPAPVPASQEAGRTALAKTGD